jgi:hypothetical protein
MEVRPQLDLPGARTEPEAQPEHGKAPAPQPKDTRWVIERIQESFDVSAT